MSRGSPPSAFWQRALPGLLVWSGLVGLVGPGCNEDEEQAAASRDAATDSRPDASSDAASDSAPHAAAVESRDGLDEALAQKCPTAEVLVTALRQRADHLQQRERELSEREHTLRAMEQAIDVQLASLEKARTVASRETERLIGERSGQCRDVQDECRAKMESLRQEYAELDQGLKRWKSVQKNKGNEDRERELLRLTKALESMRPHKAAATLSALTQETAALLLSRLTDRSSGKVLAAMAPERAAALVQQLLADTAPADQQALRALGRTQPAATGGEQEAGE